MFAEGGKVCTWYRGHKLISDSARLHNQTGMFAGICVLCIYIVVAIYIYIRMSFVDTGHPETQFRIQGT